MLPESSQTSVLERLVAHAIMPRLITAHAKARAGSWISTLPDLIASLATADPVPPWETIDDVCAHATSLAEFSASFLEPAARTLGDLWSSDRCSEFELSLGLSQLQIVLRRASASIPNVNRPAAPGGHKVLSAPPPEEPHLLGSLVACEVLRRAGWCVSRATPGSDGDLRKSLEDEWFDVLDLSSSCVFSREHRLSAMARSVRAARSSSQNPDLIVIIDGRLIHDRPGAFRDIGADAGSDSALSLIQSINGQISQRDIRKGRARAC